MSTELAKSLDLLGFDQGQVLPRPIGPPGMAITAHPLTGEQVEMTASLLRRPPFHTQKKPFDHSLPSGLAEQGTGSRQRVSILHHRPRCAAFAPQWRHGLHGEEFGAQAIAVKHRLGALTVAAGADHP